MSVSLRKRWPSASSSRAQLEVVEDLAVVQELQRAVVARERLAAAVGQVDDREPRDARARRRRLEGALAVRAAVAELGQHRADGLDLRRALQVDDAADPAHQSPQAAQSSGRCASALKRATASSRARRRISSSASPIRRQPRSASPRPPGLVDDADSVRLDEAPPSRARAERRPRGRP